MYKDGKHFKDEPKLHRVPVLISISTSFKSSSLLNISTKRILGVETMMGSIQAVPHSISRYVVNSANKNYISKSCQRWCHDWLSI